MVPPRLTAGAVDFVPSRVPPKVSVKDPRDGTEIDIEDWRRNNHDHGPVASLQQPARTQSSPPPSLDQQCHEQTLGHRPTLFVPPGLRRQNLGPRAELEFWDSPSSTMINGEANTSLTDPYDPYYPSWPPYSCVRPYWLFCSYSKSLLAPFLRLWIRVYTRFIRTSTFRPGCVPFEWLYAFTDFHSDHNVPPYRPYAHPRYFASFCPNARFIAQYQRPTFSTYHALISEYISQCCKIKHECAVVCPWSTPDQKLNQGSSFEYSVNRWPIRLESEDAKKKRIAEEEKQRKAKEANETAKQEEQRKEGKEKERSSYKQEDPNQETDRRGGEGQAEATTMSEADAVKKIDGDVKALFDLRKLDETEAYFSGLPSTYHGRLVDQLVLEAIKSKDADAALVADFFGRAASNNLCSPASFEAGFIGVAEFLGVIAINTPKAWDFMAMLITATGLDKVGQRRIASKTTDADRLLRNLCVDSFGAVEDSVQSLGNSRSTLSSSSSTSGSTLVNPSVCTEPHQKADDTVDSLQHCKSCNTSSAVLSDTRQLYASQIEEYRSREATWVEEVKFLRQQVVVWQELYKQSEKERENLIRQQRIVGEARDTSPSSS